MRGVSNKHCLLTFFIALIVMLFYEISSHKKPQRVIPMLERQTPQQREPAGEQQQVQTAAVDREAQQRALAEERERKRREEIVR